MFRLPLFMLEFIRPCGVGGIRTYTHNMWVQAGFMRCTERGGVHVCVSVRVIRVKQSLL